MNSILKRFKVYNEETKFVIDHFNSLNKLVEVNSEGEVEDIFKQLSVAFEKLNWSKENKIHFKLQNKNFDLNKDWLWLFVIQSFIILAFLKHEFWKHLVKDCLNLNIKWSILLKTLIN